MNYRKNGLRLLGLLAVAALGAMALAASAQAVTPGFLVAGKPVGETLKPTVTGAQEGTFTELVLGLKFKISCTAFSVDEGVINSNTDAKLVLLYTGCTTLTLENAEIECEVVEPVRAEFLALPAELTNGEPALLAEKIKALINLTRPKVLTEECILPFDNVVKGEICLKIKAGTNDTTEPLVLTNDTIQRECKERVILEGTEGAGFKDKVLYGTQEITFDGAATLKLTGVSHEGLTLGVSLY